MKSDVEIRARSAYETTRLAVAKCVPGDKAAENAYGVAYQRLVQLGLVPQVRKKYR